MEEEFATLEKADPEPKVIGLTGGIGSGKSSVAKIIEKQGFPVYYSDVRAKEIVNEDPALIAQIIQILGEDAYDEHGNYNRKWVAKKVFNDDNLLSQLNQTIHPAVKIDFENWAKQQKSELIFKETALLFELKLNTEVYKTLLVTAEDNLRMKRVMDRDHKNYREVEAIMQKQMPEKDKCRLADYIIQNNGSIEELAKETEIILDKISETIL